MPHGLPPPVPALLYHRCQCESRPDTAGSDIALLAVSMLAGREQPSRRSWCDVDSRTQGAADNAVAQHRSEATGEMACTPLIRITHAGRLRYAQCRVAPCTHVVYRALRVKDIVW